MLILFLYQCFFLGVLFPTLSVLLISLVQNIKTLLQVPELDLLLKNLASLNPFMVKLAGSFDKQSSQIFTGGFHHLLKIGSPLLDQI